MVRKILPTLLALASLSLAACGDYGQVEQGRVVAYDAEKKIVSFIKDAGTDDKNPQYTVLPVMTFAMPTDPAEMGAPPAAGLRVKLDLDKKIITMYSLKTKEFDELPFEVVAKHEDVDVRKQHPLVFDTATNKARPFPVVNADEKTVTIYSRRQKMLCTIKLADAAFAKYGPKDWEAGDEVRVYYKEPGKALRFMNVTRTDFTKR